MMPSSIFATWKVSWRNTPVITSITAKPKVIWCPTPKIMYHSLTLTSSRVIEYQLPRSISNMDSSDLLNVPKCSYIAWRSSIGLLVSSQKLSIKMLNNSANTISTRKSTADDQASAEKLLLIEATIKYNFSKAL